MHICHRHENRFRKEMTRFPTFILIGYLAWMPVGMQTNHGSFSVHAQWFSHQNGGADILMSLNDIMRISHAYKGGNYKKGSATKLEELGCCYYCHLGV